MARAHPRLTRRRVVISATALAGLHALPAGAATLMPTPPQTTGPFYPLELPLEAYAIETTEGFILFGGYYLSDLDPVLIEIAHRADRPWCEDGEVEAGLLRTLLHGAPRWPTADQSSRV